MKLITLLSLGLLAATASFSQKITPTQLKQLAQAEAEIKDTARVMIMANEAIDRYRADSFFTRGLIKALRVPNSFYYPFDSIVNVSKLYSPDSVFRIFTWELAKDFSSIRQKGAIQMRTVDGSLKLFPLFDNSDDTGNPVDSARSNKRWIGAIYYKIILKQFNNKNYYTLLGFDNNNEKSTKKWIEVLTFDEKGEPIFGGRYFQYANDDLKPPQPAFRFCLEYKRNAGAIMNYDTTSDAIIFAHLVSEEKDASRKYTLIPYGNYESFKWISGKWVHSNKYFDFVEEAATTVDPNLAKLPPVPTKKNDKKKDELVPSPYRIDDKNKKKEEPRKREEY